MSGTHTQDLAEIKRDVAMIRQRLFEDPQSHSVRLDRLEQASAAKAKIGWIIGTVAIGHAATTIIKKWFTT